MRRNYGIFRFALFLLVYAIILYTSTFQMKTMALSPIGPAFVPRLIAGALAVLSVLLMVLEAGRRMRGNSGNKEESATAVSDGSTFRKYSAPISLALLFLYIAILKPAGFIIASSVYLFFQIHILYEKIVARQAVIFLLLSVTISVFIYILFVRGFSLMLPAGLLG